jgi:hypothetical protein
MYTELLAASRLFRLRDTAGARHYYGLDTARRVILLFDPCWQKLDRESDRRARIFTRQITRFWEQEGITDGRVDILSE